jgi:uncharacterized protein YjiS (DUF1127 family)
MAVFDPCRDDRATRRRVPAPRSTLFALLRLYLERARLRRELAALRPDQLRDAGLDPVEVGREARKPFWRR